MRRSKTECKWFTLCPMKAYFEGGNIDKKWIDRYCHGDWESCVRFQMEERGEPHPDWMLPDGTIEERLLHPRCLYRSAKERR